MGQDRPCLLYTSLLPFLGFLAIYGIGLMLTWPGYYMSDDPIIFAYATRYYPVYWHNYLTSLFYMTAMSLFPASAAPVLLSDVCYAMTFAYIFYKAKQLYASKAYILLLAGILPFTLLGALMCFRPAIYASFFLFYFAYLFFAWKEQMCIRDSPRIGVPTVNFSTITSIIIRSAIIKNTTPTPDINRIGA